MFRFPDPTPILPQLQSFSIKKKPLTGAAVFPAVSSEETQVLTHAYPLWEFELTYEGLRTKTQNITPDLEWRFYQEYERILAVFIAVRGQYGRFYYKDHSDFSRELQFIGVGNGTTTRFRLIRTIGRGDLATIEPVGGVSFEQIPIIYVNGVPQAVDAWFIDANDYQTLEFFVAPPNGTTIAAKFYYYYYCRFVEDLPKFEEFVRNLHMLQGFRFRSTKDCGPNTPNGYPFVGVGG